MPSSNRRLRATLCRALLAAVLLAVLAVPAASPARAEDDTGWTITSFDAHVEIQSDGSLEVVESIAVDFGSLQKHGLIREIPVDYEWAADTSKLRVIAIEPSSATDFKGRGLPWTDDQDGGYIVIRIGDPNATVSGKQQYRITYTVRDGLNAFPDHDELYWNITGNAWPVPIEKATATVVFPGHSFLKSECYQGPTGSKERCKAKKVAGFTATFGSGRALAAGEGLTVALAFPTGAVPVGAPVLIDGDRGFFDYFSLNPAFGGVAGITVLLALVLIAVRWIEAGRDRRFVALYGSGDGAEGAAPFVGGDTIVVEYTPPDDLRPAEIGVLLDERADTNDVSATIVDLAARGYLQIDELEKHGWLGKPDYLLRQTGNGQGELLNYEQILYSGLFDRKSEVKLSSLKNKFYKDLERVKTKLYGRSVELGLFSGNPEKVRGHYKAIGFGVAVVGGLATWGLAYFWGAGVAGLGLPVAGLMTAGAARSMPARTAKGREMRRRALGFKRFIEVADKRRQQFYEQAGIFERYLPYAMMFGSVKKWAKVFEDLGIEVPEPTYYHGTYGAFYASDFADSVGGFGSSLAGTIASTPGGSGGSGFGGGGGSGGGGGGGGGGSW